MGKFVGVVIVGLFLALAGTTARADTVGNTIDIDMPAGPGIYSAQLSEFVKAGIDFNSEIVFGKDLNDGKNTAGTVTTNNVELDGYWHMARLHATFFERFQPYMLLGGSDLEMSWSEVNGEDILAEADTEFAWGFGARLCIIDWEEYGVKLTGFSSYRATAPGIKEVSGKNIPKDNFEIREWQAGGAISKKFEISGKYDTVTLVPYVGILYADTKTRVSFALENDGRYSYNAGGDGNQDNVGVAIGVDAGLTDIFSVNAEARFGDQEALSLGASVLF